MNFLVNLGSLAAVGPVQGAVVSLPAHGLVLGREPFPAQQNGWYTAAKWEFLPKNGEK